MNQNINKIVERYLDEIQPGEGKKNYQKIEMDDYQESIGTVVNILEAISLMADSNRVVRGSEQNTLYTIANLAELCLKLLPLSAIEALDEFNKIYKENTVAGQSAA